MTFATTSGVTTSYLYDHTGSRTKYSNGVTTTYTANNLFEKTSTTPTKSIYLGGALIATIRNTGGSAAVRLVHTDHLGGAQVITEP